MEEWYGIAECVYNDPIWLISDTQLDSILHSWELQQEFWDGGIEGIFYGMGL